MVNMVAHACDLSTQEAETGVSQLQGQPRLHSQFQISLSYISNNGLKKKTKQVRRFAGVPRCARHPCGTLGCPALLKAVSNMTFKKSENPGTVCLQTTPGAGYKDVSVLDRHLPTYSRKSMAYVWSLLVQPLTSFLSLGKLLLPQQQLINF